MPLRVDGLKCTGVLTKNAERDTSPNSIPGLLRTEHAVHRRSDVTHLERLLHPSNALELSPAPLLDTVQGRLPVSLFALLVRPGRTRGPPLSQRYGSILNVRVTSVSVHNTDRNAQFIGYLSTSSQSFYAMNCSSAADLLCAQVGGKVSLDPCARFRPPRRFPSRAPNTRSRPSPAGAPRTSRAHPPPPTRSCSAAR